MRDTHYLTCLDDQCERAACTDRRDFQHRLDTAKRKITQLETENLKLGQRVDFLEMERRMLERKRTRLEAAVKLFDHGVRHLEGKIPEPCDVCASLRQVMPTGKN